ncbi:MAG: hypothetical protein EOM54_09290 [Clostridia bacterium]|nr:hypothetical protein [Clostridia bacterium]
MSRHIHLNIRMPFSYYLNRDLDCGSPVVRPRPDRRDAYAKALEAEVRGLAKELPDTVVDSVFFLGGYMNLLRPEQFDSLMNVISRRLTLAPDIEIGGWLFPGSLDKVLMESYERVNAGPLMFEVPSLLPAECEKYRMPNIIAALNQTAKALHNMGFGNYGLRILIGVPGRTLAAWEQIAEGIICLEPAHLEFSVVDAGADNGPGFEFCQKKLEDLGYRQYAPFCWTKADKAPRYPEYRKEDAEYLGIGLAAESRLDGFWSKNTGDVGLYLRDSSNYQKIVAAAREL